MAGRGHGVRLFEPELTCIPGRGAAIQKGMDEGRMVQHGRWKDANSRGVMVFSATSTQSVKDKLKCVILHDLEHGKQGRPRKSDEKW